MRWITEGEVVAAIDLSTAIDVLEATLGGQARTGAATMAKTQVGFAGGGTLHALGGVLPGDDVVGTKTWAHTGGGASPLLTLWRAHDGSALAVIEAFALGQLRTAAMTAVGTRWLADPKASRLAVVGSGRQALGQVAAVAAVRDLDTVTVTSPTSAHREAFADRVRGSVHAEVRVVASVAEAVRDADMVVTATRAKEPFLTAAAIKPGTHLNAIGAISPGRAELAADLVARAQPVVVDNLDAARQFADELRAVDDLLELASVVASGRRPSVGDVTLFKPMGLGLADVAVGVEVLRRAPVGHTVGAPARVPPRLFPPRA